MSELRSEDQRLCNKQMSDDGWHWHPCNRPAKSLIKLEGVEQEWSPRCGIHTRMVAKNPRFEVKPL